MSENILHQYDNNLDRKQAFDAVARADLYLGRARTTRNYGLWRYAMDMMAAGVALSKTEKYGGWRPVKFPNWLREMSKMKDQRRKRNHIYKKMGSKYHLSRIKFRQEMAPYITKILLGMENRKIKEIAAEHELNEDQIAYLMGLEPDNPRINDIFGDTTSLDDEETGGGEERDKGKGKKDGEGKEETAKEGREGKNEKIGGDKVGKEKDEGKNEGEHDRGKEEDEETEDVDPSSTTIFEF